MHLESAVNDLRHVCFVGVELPARRALPRRLSPRVVELGQALRVRPRSLTALGASEPLDGFLEWLLKRAGLDAGAYRPKALQRRLPACLRALKVFSTAAAKALLEQKPEMLLMALDTVLIGVSEFFRDPAVFEELQRSVLPELLKGRRNLRVYSAGCSGGQELYSMAMLLAELGVLTDSYLVGMDCRPEAIAQARAGWFQAAELDAVPPGFRQRYFHLEGARACVSPCLREKSLWQVGDLLSGPPPGEGWDIILFRNVAIYLCPEKTRLWESLVRQLRPGGVLVTGKAERPPSDLPLKRIYRCIYKRIEK